MELIERNMRRTAEHVARSLGAAAKVDFRVNFAPLINDPQEAEYAAMICNELVGADKQRSDFAVRHEVDRVELMVVLVENAGDLLDTPLSGVEQIEVVPCSRSQTGLQLTQHPVEVGNRSIDNDDFVTHCGRREVQIDPEP